MNRYIVSREDLSNNIKKLQARANGVPIWAVIKGNGYGLGALPLARLLRDHGITRFCVTEAGEAEILRKNGFDEESILMLRQTQTREELERLIRARAILTLGSLEAATAAEELAASLNETVEAHVKVDTGMGRYGFRPEEIAELLAVYRTLLHVRVGGIYTHFNCAFSNNKLTRAQYAAFSGVVDRLRAANVDVGIVHCCNSAAFLRFPEMYCDGVRLGSALLGRMAFPTELEPVGYAETAIEELRVLPKGHTTGYGALWHAKKLTKIAIIPIGWYHGFRVSCSPDRSRGIDCVRGALSALKELVRRRGTYVLVNGKHCPVVGAVGMLHIAVDVSAINCKIGTPVRVELNPLHVKGMPILYK